MHTQISVNMMHNLIMSFVNYLLLDVGEANHINKLSLSLFFTTWVLHDPRPRNRRRSVLSFGLSRT
jgi:hypothetical protein